MRNTKLWSVLLVCMLLCACVLGVLFTGASAESAVIYGVGYTEGVDKSFDTIEAAFDDVEAIVEAGNWPEGQSLEILFAGTIEAKVSGSELVFGQKTIFTSTGKKLPITIKGTEASKASTIKVTADKIACANDYTFENLTLDTWTSKVKFFAGSGQVTFKNLATPSESNARSAYMFGDNYTAEAFEGWKKADMQALMDEDHTILTSLNFDGYQYDGSSANSLLGNIAAVGAAYNTTDDKDAYYASASDDAAFVISPADTKAMIHWISGTTTARIGGYWSEYSARVHTASIKVTGGSVGGVTGDDCSDSLKNHVVNGNVNVYIENADKCGTVRIFYGGKTYNDMTVTSDAPSGKYGNITIYAKNVYNGGAVYVAGDDNKTIPGKATISLIKYNHRGNTKVADFSAFEYIGIGAKLGVENNLTDCKVTTFSGTRYSSGTTSIGAIENTFTRVYCSGLKNGDGTVLYPFNATAFRSAYPAIKVSSVTNTFTSCNIGTTANPVEFRGSNGANVSGKVKNAVTDSTFYGAFHGAYQAICGSVENEIYSGTIPEFYGVYDYDDTNNKALNHSVGAIKNTVYGGTIGHYDVYDGEYASYKGRVQTGDFKASNVSYSAPDTRTYFNGAYYATVKNNVENIIEGGTIHAYRGSYYGSAAKVINTVKNGGKSAPQIGPDLAQTAETAYYFGIYGTKATQVENNLMGGTIVYLRGTYHTNSDTYKIQKIYNLIDGAQIKRGYTGVHASVFKEVVTEVKSGNITSAFYPVYSQKKTVGDVVNIISGGAFSGGDVCLGGYGGKLINSVTTTISGDPTFANGVYFGGGSKVWPSRVGSITTEVTGGTFSNTVCGGGRSCYVTGDIDTKLLGGTFKKSVYGGNFEAFRSGSNNADTSFYGKSVDGTIKLTVGELGKAGPMFEHYLSGGDSGVADNLTKEPVDVLVNFYSGTVTGNFYAGSEGQHSRLATVVSNVYGGTFNGKYFGGTYKSTITGNVTNHFHGGIFNGNVYGGGNNSSIEGTVLNNVYDGFVSNVTYYGGSSSGTVNIVKNVIRGGSFVGNGAIPGDPDSKPTYFDAYLGGEGKVTGGIINEISGGEFKYYTIAGTNGTVVSNSTEGAPAIKNIITGGTFHNFWGGNSKNNNISGDIVNEISGGLFDSFKDSKQTYPNCFNGGNRNGAHAGGDIINNVSGGVFKWHFTAGNNAHQLSMGLAGVEPAYAVTTNITGGIFEGHIYADYRPGTVGDGDFHFATATLNITQTEGKELAIYATVDQCDSFAANGEAIKIGKKTAILAENVSGTVSLNQTQGWLCKKYFTIVSGNGKFGEITTASAAFGNYATENYMEGEEGPAYVTRLYGVSAAPVATSLILDKKLTVRVLFDPEEIAPYGTDFTFAAALGENALDTVFEEYTVDGVTYASYLIKGIGLGNFTEAIEISGAAFDTMTFSVVGLADTGAEYYENENAIASRLFKSIADLGRKENREDTKYDLVVSAVNWTPGDDQKPKALDERLSMKTIGLVMSDAIGIRLTGETAETLKFIVNGKDVTSNCVVTASEGTFTADMYVKVSMMTSPLNIVITDGEGTAMFTMTVRVDALAEQIAASTEEDAQLIDFALAYVQAADAYVKA